MWLNVCLALAGRRGQGELAEAAGAVILRLCFALLCSALSLSVSLSLCLSLSLSLSQHGKLSMCSSPAI